MSDLTPGPDHVAQSPVRVAITRAWNDLAPKLVAWLLGGSATAVILHVATTYFGLVLDPTVANAIVIAVGTILGYFVRDKAVIDAGSVKPGDVAVITALKTPAGIE